MKMVTINNEETSIVSLDSSLLPKYYKISAGEYDIDLGNGSNITVSANGFNPKNHDINKIIELINELSYAAKGYKDCEMQPAKFNRLVASFSYKRIAINDIKS